MVEEVVEQVAHQVMEVQEEAPLHLVVMVVEVPKPLVAVEEAVVIMKTKPMVDLVDLVVKHKVVLAVVVLQKMVVDKVELQELQSGEIQDLVLQ